MSKASRRFMSLFLIGLGAGSFSHGATVQIDWGTSAAFQELRTSEGSSLSLSEFTVELGAFDNGFVPNTSNTESWVANWRVFDAITLNDTDTNGPKSATADGFISQGLSSRFVGTGYLDADNTSLSEDAILQGTDSFEFGDSGLQAYVFIRNADLMEEGSEWLLYTSETGDEWEFPDGSATQQDFPESWFLSDVDTVVWGGVAGLPEGGGEHSDPSSSFTLRTHTIPEPSGFLLLSVGGALAATRRSRVGQQEFE